MMKTKTEINIIAGMPEMVKVTDKVLNDRQLTTVQSILLILDVIHGTSHMYRMYIGFEIVKFYS